MDIKKRQDCIHGKIKIYAEELVGLKGASLGYQLGFGILLFILLPLLFFEIWVVLVFGKDVGEFKRRPPPEQPRIVNEDVPESLRDLIPLASKFGIGDDGDRDEVLKAASSTELSELAKTVQPRQQEIADWLATFPEAGITDTAAFFMYLSLACEELPLYMTRKRTRQTNLSDR